MRANNALVLCGLLIKTISKFSKGVYFALKMSRCTAFFVSSLPSGKSVYIFSKKIRAYIIFI